MPDVKKTLSLDDLIEMGGKHAKTVLINRRETELTPILHLMDRNGKSHIVACIWANDIQKQLVMLRAKKEARDIGAIAAMFVGEIWMYPPEDTPNTRAEIERQYRLCPPSQHPRRQEAVLSVATADGKNFKHAMWQIIRNRPGGRVMSLVRIPYSAGVVMESSLLEGLIPDQSERTTH